jgi:hypothetical protein
MSEAQSMIIVAPHPDDEIIGAYEYLDNHGLGKVIIYGSETDPKRREETKTLRECFKNIKAQLFQTTIPQPFLQKTNKFLFPDPHFEVHPDHRQWGFMGEQLARQGFDVIFYSVIMNAPYIHRLAEKAKDKEDILNKVYPSQSDLWKYDKKYVLFEGRCKWIF